MLILMFKKDYEINKLPTKSKKSNEFLDWWELRPKLLVSPAHQFKADKLKRFLVKTMADVAVDWV